MPGGRRAAVVGVCVVVLGTLLVAPPPAGAYHVPRAFEWVTNDVRYGIDAAFLTAFPQPAARDAFHRADWNWEVHGLGNWYNPWDDGLPTNPNRIGVCTEETCGREGVMPGYLLALTSEIGCLSSGRQCHIWFDPTEPWYFGTGSPPAGQVDFESVATHEFGHWIGLGHSGGYYPQPGRCEPNFPQDVPSSDNQRPVTMAACYQGVAQRTLTEDDIQAFHVTRPRYRIMTANDSLEFEAPLTGPPLGTGVGNGGIIHGFRYLGPGSATRWYDPPQAYHGGVLLQFNGAGSSIYQDIYNRSEVRANLRARIRARNGTGAPIRIAVGLWERDRGVDHKQEYTVPADNTWHQYTSDTFNQDPTSTLLRLEVWNVTGTNLSVDTLIVDWQPPQ